MRKIIILFAQILSVCFANAQFPAPYCGESFSPVTSINKVVFANLTNTIPSFSPGAAHRDFTSLVANVTQGNTYTLSVSGYSNSLLDYYRVYFDWNQNGNFSDAGEQLDMGRLFSSGADGATLSFNVTIPLNALGGVTRMRIAKRNISYPSPCNATASAGQAHDYTLNITTLPPCSAPLIGGNAVSADASVCPTTSVQLSVNGATAGFSGVSFQWQSSPDGSNWTDISGAISTSLSTFQSSATYYRRLIQCAAGGSASSTAVLVGMKPLATCYCVPSPTVCTFYYMDSVAVGSLANVSACGSSGYSDYTTTAISPSLQAGTYQLLTVRTGGSGSKVVKVWIDFNQNGVFEDNEQTEVGRPVGAGVVKKWIRIPFNAKGGITRMRLRAIYSYYDWVGACGNYSTGTTDQIETEDYNVSIIPSSTPNATFVFYVKANATGANNGLTWADAYTSLYNALSSALPSDTIKVAKGMYKPSGSAFSMKDSVVVFGGYPDSGNPTETDRNWRTNQTILSGELGVPGYSGNFPVLLMGSSLSSVTLWDGFILQETYGYGSGSRSGAVVLSFNSRPVLRNFLFRNNYASESNDGTAITAINSSPTVINSVFVNNNVSFLTYSKGIVYSSNGSPVFYNCVFANNGGFDSSSALYHSGGNPQIVNCTFFGNVCGYRPEGAVVVGTSGANISINNSIFYENRNINKDIYQTFSPDSSELVLSNSTASVQNCIFQNYKGGNNVQLSVNPRFRDTADLDGPDNLFFTADDGLSLTNPCSPGLNAGNNALANLTEPDLAGSNRVFGTVDLGAYEMPATRSTPLKTVYVNKAATGTNDGSSWSNAFTDLQKALQYCADTVKVAAGTYPPSQANTRSFFTLENKKVLLGGYPSTGNPSDADRDASLYPTVLSGKLPNGSQSSIIIKSKNVDSTTMMDGFTVRDCSPIRPALGSLYLLDKASPTIKNCRIAGNSFGIVSQKGSDALFLRCTLDSNYFGATIIISARPRFQNCNFIHNRTGATYDDSYDGAAVNNRYASPVFDSCRFAYNTASHWGGAIMNSISQPQFTHCIFTANTTSEYGGDVFNDSSNAQFDNCTFNDTLTVVSGGSIFNSGSAPVFRFCQFKNSKATGDGGVVFNELSSPTFISCAFSKTGNFYSRLYSRPTLINCIAAMPATDGTPFMKNVRTVATLTNVTFVRQGIPGEVSQSGALVLNTDSSQLTVKNSIFWGGKLDTKSPAPDIVNDPNTTYTSSTTINNSITQAYGTNGVNGNLVGINPRLSEYNDPDGKDNEFFTPDDGLTLSARSPAIDAGSTNANNQPVDILNQNRVYGNGIDIGAYERQSPAGGFSKTVYVNPSSTGNGDGSSWANAYTSLWPAIENICADTVKVASGVYKPAVFDRDSSFLLQHNKTYLGGYPSTGSPADIERNPTLYPTVLSGNIGSPADSSDNTKHVLLINNADTLVTLDGFVIQDGLANVGQLLTQVGGGGILAVGSKVKVLNCVLQKNTAVAGGGMMISASDYFKISRTVVRANRSTGRGGGLYLFSMTGNVQGVVENSVMAANYAGAHGGGIFGSGSNGFYTAGINYNNVIFYSNTAAFQGGGMYTDAPYKTYVTNCTFVRNHAAVASGAGLYNRIVYQQDQGFPQIYNCVFKSNSLAVNSTDETYMGSDIAEENCPAFNCYRSNIRYNRVQSFVNYFDMNNVYVSPRFKNELNPEGPDNQWLTDDDGLQLSPTSLLVDAGDLSSVAAIPFDALRNKRVNGPKPDLGAYESTGPACGGKVFTASESGNSFQWQVNEGNGFINIQNDAVYGGAQTGSLTLTGAPTSWYGYTYRCVVTNANGTAYSKTDLLTFEAVWTGGTSNAWNDPANWNCGKVPDGNTDVYVFAGTSNYPFVNINAICRTVSVQEGASLTIGSGYTLTTTH
ncbi:right-handed parallel beta-helix repeat-containing protein [Flavisolibacter ginsenosidimutans]|uniref:GEVED domain-containing protein n=1 Tax=Flavisolibacter ginsenosidimutans TaxID=661481 RepID=A0A5B8UPS5_9BACT|nr:right-handed parallel beta-helix repeat-containing protein [Flavisolibacter ginsenosidimutans]QEC58372.1 hypothetical protein FSB75_21520 [Flavisolibacter ginsenosidimutans]